MVEITYQMVLSTLQTLSIMVGIGYYVLTLRNQDKARQAQLFMQLYNRFVDPEFLDHVREPWTREWDDIDDFRQKYLVGEYPRDLGILMNFFEGFGVLLKKGLIDGDLLYEQIPTNAYTIWERYEPWAKWVRAEANYPQYMRPLEYLANEMKKIAISRGDPILTIKDHKKAFGK
jgi:hypothetical protein